MARRRLSLRLLFSLSFQVGNLVPAVIYLYEKEHRLLLLRRWTGRMKEQPEKRELPIAGGREGNSEASQNQIIINLVFLVVMR